MTKDNKDLYDNLADQIIESGVNLSEMFKKDDLLKHLTKSLLEKALEGEMNHHLGYNKSQRSTNTNSRNGQVSKTLSTDNGHLHISVPRDRESKF